MRSLVDKQSSLKLANKAVNGGGLDIVCRLKDEIRILLTQEEKLWQQQSRIAWLKYGDKNSCYFHSRA